VIAGLRQLLDNVASYVARTACNQKRHRQFRQ
jgi:hypothetical protein